MGTNHVAVRCGIYLVSLVFLFPSFHHFLGQPGIGWMFAFVFGLPLVIVVSFRRLPNTKEWLIDLHTVACIFLSIASMVFLSIAGLWHVIAKFMHV